MKTTKRKAYFEIYDAWGQHDETHEWRWRLVAKNSEVLASGEGFTTKASATRAVQAVKRAVLAIVEGESKLELDALTINKIANAAIESTVQKSAFFGKINGGGNARIVKGRDRR